MSALVASWHDDPPAPTPGVPFSHFQSGHWSRLLRRYGQRPLCVWVRDGTGPPLASWLLYSTPGDYLRPPLPPARWLDVHLRGVHSPAIDPRLDRAERERVLTVLLEAVAARVRRVRPISCSVGLDPVLSDDQRDDWVRLAAAAGFDAAPQYTYMAHVPSTTDELWLAIKRDRRPKIRKAEKLGVVFEEAHGLEALREYADVRNETRRRNGHDPVPWDHFAATWETLAGSSIYRIFLARLNGRIGAGQLAFVWNGYVYLSGVSTAQWAVNGKLPANDYLQWRLLEWAVEEGRRLVDFGGAQPHSDDPKLRAIDAFKSRWGTRLEESLALSLTPRGAGVRGRAAALAQRLLG
jgi:CelD/BcsL family acetyltransferase involved in cellulose biosynthesis